MAAKSPRNSGIAVLLADDHEVFRLGLRQLLCDRIGARRIIEAEDFAVALEHLDDPDIFLALVDLGMPGLAGPRDLEQIRRKRPSVRLVVVSGSDAREDILAALQAGAHGYIVKSSRTSEIVRRVQQVLNGEICVPWCVSELPTEHDVPSAKTLDGSGPSLTERQLDVLRLIAEGQPNKAIGRSLGISEGTVKMHVSVILRAIGAANRAQAAAIGKTLLE